MLPFLIPTTPEQIEEYVQLAKTIGGLFAGLIASLKKAGLSPEQIAAITADYDARIAQAEAEAAPPAAQ